MQRKFVLCFHIAGREPKLDAVYGDSETLAMDYARDELRDRTKGIDGLVSVALGVVPPGEDDDDADWLGMWERQPDGSFKWTRED